MARLDRPGYRRKIEVALDRSPIVALLGPRQCGKTTLAREIATGEKSTYFDLEAPRDLVRLENPSLTLGPLRGLVVIDEVQRQPDLFPLLRVLADRDATPARFLILGSASPRIVRGISESLAGRVEFVDLGPFGLDEVDERFSDRLWVRGGFPRSFLARTEEESFVWRENFIRTFLERDLASLGLEVPGPAMRRFWTMLAHYHGQIWNASQIARSLGLSDKTAGRYLDLLAGTYMLRPLPPWHENLAKRQVKVPKVYIRDSGITHALLSLSDREVLLGHPKLGASWEGFALEQVLRRLDLREAYFWATHGGAELDLVFFRRGRRYGVEFKWADAPRMTRSIRVALRDLRLEHVWIVHPGSDAYDVDEQVTVVPLTDLSALEDPSTS